MLTSRSHGDRMRYFNMFPDKKFPLKVLATSSPHSCEKPKYGKASHAPFPFSNCHPGSGGPMQEYDCGWLRSQRGQYHQQVQVMRWWDVFSQQIWCSPGTTSTLASVRGSARSLTTASSGESIRMRACSFLSVFISAPTITRWEDGHT